MKRILRIVNGNLWILRGIALAFALFVVASCAKKASPEGGPYDMTPPKLIRSNPANGAVNVRSKKIKLRFDENVKLEKQSEKVIFDPPQRKLPQITAGVGKSITIKFEEDFLDSTTYAIDFSDAIVDLNEGNPIDGFTFAFSTGPVIDSMLVSGKIIDARTLQPLPDISVGLYKDLNPEELTTKTMLRVTKSTEEGNFMIKYLSAGEYEILGIDDVDRSYTYTGPSEGIAFLSEKVVSISPDSITKDEPGMAFMEDTEIPEDSTASVIPDTLSIPDEGADVPLVDTLEIIDEGIDAPLVDTLKTTKNPAEEAPFVEEDFTPSENRPSNILLFSRDRTSKMALQRATRPDSATLKLQFTAPIDSLPAMTLLESDKTFDATHRQELGDDRMELLYWITDSSLYRQDTLRYLVGYQATDSLFRLTPRTDTLTLVYQKPDASSNAPKKSIFSKWREKRRARREAREAKEKARREAENPSAADSLKLLEAADSVASAEGADSIPLAPQLQVTFVEQDNLRKGFPEEPLYIEFSEVPLSLDTAGIHLYHILLDSTYYETQLPDPEAETPENEASQSEDAPPVGEFSFQGGAANPYESGIERYGTEEERREIAENETPKAPPYASKGEKIPPGERISIPYSLEPHPFHARRYRLRFDADFDSHYLLVFDSLAVRGVYGAEGVPLELLWKSEPESAFGSLCFQPDSLLHPGIAYCELLDDADSVLLQLPLSDTVSFENVTPGRYFARIWFDLNANGQWDGGSYPDRFPEPTYYYPKALEIKERFVQKILWRLDALPIYEQRPKEMAKSSTKETEKPEQDRRNLNEEYVARMKERYGEKWNPTNRTRRMLGMPSRKEEKQAKKKSAEASEAQDKKTQGPVEEPLPETDSPIEKVG